MVLPCNRISCVYENNYGKLACANMKQSIKYIVAWTQIIGKICNGFPFMQKKECYLEIFLTICTKYYVVVFGEENGSGKEGILLFIIYPLKFLNYFSDCT